LPDKAQSVAPAHQEPPLCVDLDGTLVKSDTLMDALCQLVRSSPLVALQMFQWLAGGRAGFKRQVANRVQIDAVRLPYNNAVLRFLQAEHRAGRPLYLATGADSSVANRVAAHLGLFDGIYASDGKTNLTNRKKLALLKKQFGQFDYIGNARADLSLLQAARKPMVANPSLGLRLGLAMRNIHPAQIFRDHRSVPRTLLKAVRIHQWAKNILLLVPMLLSHQLSAHSIAAVIAAFFCFSFMASANYLVNDLIDIESDRRHPGKRLRPFAAGDLSVAGGVLLAALLFVSSLCLLPLLPAAFALWVAAYIAATTSYTVYFKRIAIVDVLLLSGLYTLRLLAGGAATNTPISHWLAGFSTFLFLSLAMVKRFSELENLRERGAIATHGRGYLVADLEQIRTFGTSSATASVVIFSVYISGQDVAALYNHAGRLWLIVPLLLLWLYRVWLLASRGELDDDPVVFAMRDRISLAIGAGVILLAIVAA
jgi:4-hydroxybenzoate polyprenyltransferase